MASGSEAIKGVFALRYQRLGKEHDDERLPPY